MFACHIFIPSALPPTPHHCFLQHVGHALGCKASCGGMTSVAAASLAKHARAAVCGVAFPSSRCPLTTVDHESVRLSQYHHAFLFSPPHTPAHLARSRADAAHVTLCAHTRRRRSAPARTVTMSESSGIAVSEIVCTRPCRVVSQRTPLVHEKIKLAMLFAICPWRYFARAWQDVCLVRLVQSLPRLVCAYSTSIRCVGRLLLAALRVHPSSCGGDPSRPLARFGSRVPQ